MGFSRFFGPLILKLCAEMSNLVGSKTLCEILTVADAIPLPMADPMVDNKLSRHGFGLLSLNTRYGPIRGWLSQRGCSAARTSQRLTRQREQRSKCRIRRRMEYSVARVHVSG